MGSSFQFLFGDWVADHRIPSPTFLLSNTLRKDGKKCLEEFSAEYFLIELSNSSNLFQAAVPNKTVSNKFKDIQQLTEIGKSFQNMKVGETSIWSLSFLKCYFMHLLSYFVNSIFQLLVLHRLPHSKNQCKLLKPDTWDGLRGSYFTRLVPAVL